MQLISQNMQKLLRPRSIAIVGASPRDDSFAASVRRSVRSLGFPGEVHLVNPRYDRIAGEACYPSLAALPATPDCALFAINDTRLVSALEDAAGSGVGAGVIFGRGHGAAADGRPIHDALSAIGRTAGMAICGSNCMGFLNLVDGIQATGMPFVSLGRPSGACLISHSGSTWSGLVGNRRGIGFDYAVSAGQELVTNVGDYIDYLLDQGTARVIACVIETLREPGKFLAAVDRADRMGVPIIALKLGRSDMGRRFAVSHSGAISGSAAAYEAVFRARNVIQVRTLDEMLDTIELFAAQRRPQAAGLALGTDSGGERQLIVDIAADIGLDFATLSDATLATLDGLLDPGMEAANPVDYWGDGTDVMMPCLSAMAEDPGVAMVVMAANMPPGRTFVDQCADALIGVYQRTRKPVALMGNISTTMAADGTARVREAGIPVLMGTETGLRAIKHFLDHAKRAVRQETGEPEPGLMTAKWRERIAAVRTATLSSADGFDLLNDFGIESAPFARIGDEAQLETFIRRASGPIVLKIDDPEIPHKSEAGGVFLGLSSEATALEAFAALRRRHPSAPVLAQKQMQGHELILGMTTDPDFGPMVTIGLGGIYTEVFRDVAVVAPPVDHAAAIAALRSLRSFPILAGARGRVAADLDALANAVVTFGRLSAELADLICEMEINPLLAGPDGAVAVDSLIVRKEAIIDVGRI